jgi:hypothetical protein
LVAIGGTEVGVGRSGVLVDDGVGVGGTGVSVGGAGVLVGRGVLVGSGVGLGMGVLVAEGKGVKVGRKVFTGAATSVGDLSAQARHSKPTLTNTSINSFRFIVCHPSSESKINQRAQLPSRSQLR